ncbi:MAG: phage major capsid protein [Planctomycetes bacterium]|nr:phage major capsid protein [Planctomycetota bacterium]
MELERRFTIGLEVRRHNGKPSLEGLCVPYESRSEDMGFRETIAKGAFSKHLRSDPDVKAFVEHDISQIIGRTRAGTLRLEESDDGVHVSIDPPDSQRGHDLVESVRRGDLTAMSFGFRVLDDTWELRDGESHRRVTEAELVETSVTSSPSYPETSIALRSLDRWQKETRKMEPKRETLTTKPEVLELPHPSPERTVPAEPIQATETKPKPANPNEWRNFRTGEEVRVLSKDQKFADLHSESEPLSLGRAVRAMIVGDWSGAEAEQRVLSTTSNPSAGFLIPDPLAARVIDLARNQSVLVRAGAQTVAMSASTLDIARVTADATMEVKSENAAFTDRDVAFDRVTLVAYTIGTTVTMSRELAADAPNATSIIEQTIAAKLAERLDFYGLQGTGSQQPTGLLNMTGVNTTSVGTLSYTDLLTALKECEIDNYPPSSVVLSPTSWDALRKLLINAEANHYAVAPPAVATLTPFSTGNMTDTDGIVGDFSKLIIGLRQSPLVEVTTTGGDTFKQHQVQVKITWRGDFAADSPLAFCTLTDI